MKAPFPWFGGKSKVAGIVWQRFGDVPNYVEPFAGSLAVLLGRSTQPRVETVNDKDGFLANFWRALARDPEGVAREADWPVNENDLQARHAWLVPQREALSRRLEGDPEHYDVRIAGWWVWGLCCWIGTGWCSGNGPWSSVDGMLVKGEGQCVSRQLPHLRSAGQGVNRPAQDLTGYFQALAERLRRVRVCCGDWGRVLGSSPTIKLGLTGVFLDPPYDLGIRCEDCYSVDEVGLSDKVRKWAIGNGGNPLLRIALCGYEGEHDMPEGWECVVWKSRGGYARTERASDNAHKERIWFSPACLKVPRQGELQ